MFKSCLSRFGDSRWRGSLRTIPAGSKAFRLSTMPQNNSSSSSLATIVTKYRIPSCLTNIKLKLDFIIFLKYLNSFYEKTSQKNNTISGSLTHYSVLFVSPKLLKDSYFSNILIKMCQTFDRTT